MKLPTNYEKCLSILILRTLNIKRDAVSSIVGCSPSTVYDVEQWIRSCPLDEAVNLCDDQAIKRLVGREFPGLEEISGGILVKAAQLEGQDILRHYREDFVSREIAQDPLTGEAKRKHFRTLSEVIKEWQDDLGFKVDPPKRWFQTVFPDEFKADDAKRGQHVKGSLIWDVNHSGDVEVRFEVEDSPLFQFLKPHIPNEKLWRDFEKLKQALTDGIKKVTSVENRAILVRDATGLAANIYDELEIVLARGAVFPGKCPSCPDYK